MQHTFFCTFLCRTFAVHFFVHFFPRLQRETSRNFLVTRFMQGMSYVLSLIFFFHCRSFSPFMVAASISHFLTTATKFAWCSPNKKMSPLFFTLALDLCHPFFSMTFAGLPPTFPFSLSFSFSIFQICGHDN